MKTEDDTSRRRAAELGGLFDVHKVNVDQAHKDYPTRSGSQFMEMDHAERERWNERRKVIDSANKAYNRAVKEAVKRHAEEDRIFAKKQTDPAHPLENEPGAVEKETV